MISAASFQQIALSFPDTSAAPHFHRTAFKSGRIFATLDEKKKEAVILLSPADQSVFCSYDKSVTYPVPNKWGKKGATVVVLKKVKRSMLKDMLQLAYERSLKPARLRKSS